jgi:mannitol 2-dehydrogenase
MQVEESVEEPAGLAPERSLSSVSSTVVNAPIALTGSRLPDLERFRNQPVSNSSPLRLPTYDRTRLTGGLVHLGIGGFQRAHLAVYLDDLAEQGESSWSMIASGVTAHDELLGGCLVSQDGLYLLAEREGESAEGRVIGSITDVMLAHRDQAALINQLSDASTQIVSLTITESGYPIRNGSFAGSDALSTDVNADVPSSTFGVLVAALDARRKAGLAPFTVMSCDNLPGNGTVAREAVLGAAALRSEGLGQWVALNGAFPNAMVDRITPQTTDADRVWVEETFGIVDKWPVICEPFRQWALEDSFVASRPAFEQVGVLMTADVTVYEHMKLRLLNGSHSGLAYLAALAGIHYVHDAVRDIRFAQFLRQFMKTEAAPNLESPPGINLDEYQESLLRRFSNPAIADTVARLCMDGTAKFPTFIVPTAEAQIANGGTFDLTALIIAGWCRYLRGIADDGSALTLAHDPGLAEAVDAAHRSSTEPRAFLAFDALGPNIVQSQRFVDTFAAALDDLSGLGVMGTLTKWVTKL